MAPACAALVMAAIAAGLCLSPCTATAQPRPASQHPAARDLAQADNELERRIRATSSDLTPAQLAFVLGIGSRVMALIEATLISPPTDGRAAQHGQGHNQVSYQILAVVAPSTPGVAYVPRFGVCGHTATPARVHFAFSARPTAAGYEFRDLATAGMAMCQLILAGYAAELETAQ